MLKTMMYVVAISLFAGTVFAAGPDVAAPEEREAATATAGDKIRVIDQIMVDSGMDKIIEQMPAMAAAGFDQQPPPPAVSRATVDRFRENYLAAFDPGKMRKAVVDHLDAHYDAGRFADYLAMINSPLAKKMTALELASATPQAEQEKMQMANIIMGQPPAPRLALAQRLDAAQRASEGLVEVQTMMAGAMIRSMNTIVPKDKQMTDEQISRGLEQMAAQSLYPARQYIQLSIIYAYRSATDEELRQYVELYEAETGRWFSGLTRDAFIKLFENLSSDLAERMRTAFIENNAL